MYSKLVTTHIMTSAMLQIKVGHDCQHDNNLLR